VAIGASQHRRHRVEANIPKVIPDDLPIHDGPDSAEPFGGRLGDYIGSAISEHHGMRRLGANIETLMPGASSSHRHWHDRSDELVVVLHGELFLRGDSGDTRLMPGDVAVFPAGDPNGHCLANRSDTPADFLVVGTRDPDDRWHYVALDLVLHPDETLWRRDGTPAIADPQADSASARRAARDDG
jgi:uncharacterized cupin superfamily protein